MVGEGGPRCDRGQEGPDGGRIVRALSEGKHDRYGCAGLDQRGLTESAAEEGVKVGRLGRESVHRQAADKGDGRARSVSAHREIHLAPFLARPSVLSLLLLLLHSSVFVGATSPVAHKRENALRGRHVWHFFWFFLGCDGRSSLAPHRLRLFVSVARHTKRAAQYARAPNAKLSRSIFIGGAQAHMQENKRSDGHRRHWSRSLACGRRGTRWPVVLDPLTCEPASGLLPTHPAGLR